MSSGMLQDSIRSPRMCFTARNRQETARTQYELCFDGKVSFWDSWKQILGQLNLDHWIQSSHTILKWSPDMIWAASLLALLQNARESSGVPEKPTFQRRTKMAEISSRTCFFGFRKSRSWVHLWGNTILEAFFEIRFQVGESHGKDLLHKLTWSYRLWAMKFSARHRNLHYSISESHVPGFTSRITPYSKRFSKFGFTLEKVVAEICCTEWQNQFNIFLKNIRKLPQIYRRASA